MPGSHIQNSVPAGDEPIDWAHLDRATLGDGKVAAEVLALFVTQAGDVAATIRHLPAETARLAHGIKGAARGIGARRVARAAQALEQALAGAAPVPPALAELLAALTEARIAAASRASTG
jgi:HPt (histidine-containing phosphotransfer) domain-containing protein